MWKDIVTTPERKLVVLEVLKKVKRVIPEENEDIINEQILLVVDIDI
ncbi:MAG: hypothetical protein GPJ52_01810 [Candidatus Heimdallarchaeota archaeon]|nr:hypothetical protein [Candidatus Heimdallarchaeota archaeon]